VAGAEVETELAAVVDYPVISVPEPSGLTEVSRTVAAARADGLDGFDLVVELPVGEDADPWAAAGATWALTRVGPYEMDLHDVRRVIRAGPA
jgi:hypothetical protein